MEVISKQDHGKDDDEAIIWEINLADSKIIDILRYTDDIDEEDLVKTLNSIDNQGIESVDLRKCSYRVNDEELAFDCLCSAEKIFLVAYMADKKKQKIYLTYWDIGSLTKTTLKLFIKTFWDSKYVNIMFDYSECDAFFEWIVGEALA